MEKGGGNCPWQVRSLFFRPLKWNFWKMSSNPKENEERLDGAETVDTHPVPAEPGPDAQGAGVDEEGLATQGGDPLQAAQERYLRLYADFENFKRRAAREREETRRATMESLVGQLLPVLDTFEMAIQAAQQPGTTLETLRMGVEMIQGQMRNIFSDLGVEEIDARGRPFDPAVHEAVSQEETADQPEGTVVHQGRKGYRLRERLIRPASVVVAKAPGVPASPTPAST